MRISGPVCNEKVADAFSDTQMFPVILAWPRLLCVRNCMEEAIAIHGDLSPPEISAGEAFIEPREIG